MRQFAHFVVNGLVAAGVYFALLSLFIEVCHFSSAALAGALAYFLGTGVAFIGNRFFVFRARYQPVAGQVLRFVVLYAAMGLLHSAVLLAWTDLLRLDYRIGFVIATALQIGISFISNRRLVFRPQHTVEKNTS